jgi:UDP-N-acetylglucosamine 2-epimerase (non-hydrolysing)/GDP/UDP-N,N'-diacetylbacillosamine 2-epimerase (hydrolysing)
MRIILAVTGTRSDWGLMTPVYQAIAAHPDLHLECLMTGMHLLPHFAESKTLVEKEFPGPIHSVPILEDGNNSNAAMARSLGHAVLGMTDHMNTISPDILLLQGDRGEMLAAAIVAAHLNIPVVHMSGGDRSGTIDDSLRHAISTFAHIHLTTCEASSAELVRQCESPGRIMAVGEPGIDCIKRMDFLDREALNAELGLTAGKPIIIVAQHPVTTESSQSAEQMRATLEAVTTFVSSGEAQAVLSAANTDAGGEVMNAVIAEYAAKPGFYFRPSFGSRLFLSLLKAADVIIGNSSSGILEAPSFGLPAVNIGTRQHGRLRADNVLDIPAYDIQSITAALYSALNDATFRSRARMCTNPYGDGRTSERTIVVLEALDLSHQHLVPKWLDKGEDFLGFARAFAFN